MELIGLQQEVAQLKAQLSMSQIESQRRSDQLATAEAALAAANGRIREGESARRRLHDTVMVSQIRYLQCRARAFADAMPAVVA